MNWWQQIRYDLKTIIATGWHHALIPDDYLIAEFFQAEADEIEAIEARLAKTDGILVAIGGQLSEEQARRLILKKLYDFAHNELNRYLNAEKRGLIRVVENLWDKYAVSSRELECLRTETLKTLDGFLNVLGYLEDGS